MTNEKRNVICFPLSLIVYLLWVVPVQAAAVDGLTIPSAHPRLWWTPARITQAQQWLAAHPFTPNFSDYISQAMLHVIDPSHNTCSSAATWASGVTFDTSGTASDEARWSGEAVIVVFDWCNDVLSASQKRTMISRWNGYISTLNDKQWGGPGMESNNYYWGYLRNSFEWGVASYGEQPSTAQGFIDNALVTRWQNGVVPYLNGANKGGVFMEGSQYGIYMGYYSAIPWASAVLMGRDILKETNFYREVIANMIYQTTPQPTYVKGSNTPYYQVMPFNQDETYQSASDFYYGDLMSVLAAEWAGTPLGSYAQQWINTINPTVEPFAKSVFTSGSASSFSTLPLDYFASGPGFFYTKNKWGSGSTYVQMQTGLCLHCGHTNADNGNFQIERNGYWMTKASTQYSVSIPGWGGSGSIDVAYGPAHNVLFYNGAGPSIDYTRGSAKVVRLESAADYAYMASDLSISFHASDSRFDNPAAGTTIREFLFIKPLETLVVLDRMQSTSASAKEGLAIHFENNPTVSGTKILGTNGSNTLEVNSILPGSPTTRVINEGSNGRYRLELETSGQTQTYFLTALQVRDSSGPSLTLNSTSDANTITLTLQHPTLGSAKVIFNKGASSTGGQFGYLNGTTIPTALTSLSTTIESIQVTDNGVSWAGGSTPPPPPPSSGSACDLNGDTSTNVTDVQLVVNQAIGVSACTADVNNDGLCNVIDVQRVVNAALGGICVTP